MRFSRSYLLLVTNYSIFLKLRWRFTTYSSIAWWNINISWILFLKLNICYNFQAVLVSLADVAQLEIVTISHFKIFLHQLHCKKGSFSWFYVICLIVLIKICPFCENFTFSNKFVTLLCQNISCLENYSFIPCSLYTYFIIIFTKSLLNILRQVPMTVKGVWVCQCQLVTQSMTIVNLYHNFKKLCHYFQHSADLRVRSNVHIMDNDPISVR